MTAGVPREARSLSGCDIGRELYIEELRRWRRITGVTHGAEHNGSRETRLTFEGPGAMRLDPHDIVQVRGRSA